MPAYEYGEMKWSEMSEQQRQDATGGDRSKHMDKKDKYEERVDNKAAQASAKEKAQVVLNAANTTGDPNKFPDGSPRDPVTGNAPVTTSSNNSASQPNNSKPSSNNSASQPNNSKPAAEVTTQAVGEEGGGGNKPGNPNKWPDGTPRSVNTNNDITYNYADAGKEGKFDVKDMQNMADQGYSDNEISNYAQGLARDQVGAGVQVKTGSNLPDDVSNLDNYNPMSIGNIKVAQGKEMKGNHLQKAELKHLMTEGGHSAQELNEWAKANDYSLGGKAQKFLNKQLNLPTTDVTAPPDEEPDINTDPDKNPSVTKMKGESGVGEPEGPGKPTEPEIDGPPITTAAMYENGAGDGFDDPPNTTMAVGIGENGADDYITIPGHEEPTNTTHAVGEEGGGGINVGGDDNIVGDGNVEGDDNQYVDGNDNFVSDGDIDDSVLIGGDNEGVIANDGGVAVGDGGSIDANVGNTSGDRFAGDFMMDNGSSFIGTYQPNADYSVTIGNNTFGGGGTPGGSGTTGFNNMQNATAYGALNNNAWLTSQSFMNGITRGTQASALANLTTNADARINALDYNAQSQPQTWQDRYKNMQNNMWGDTSKYNFTWNNPTKAEPITTTYNS